MFPKLWSRQATRQLLSNFWIPTGGKTAPKNETTHDMLVRTGYLRQSQPGVFHLLPLGHLVQTKIEERIAKHMFRLGATRLSMSSLTTEELWRKSGRFENVKPELFQLKDRKDVSMMLAPTHEEEITSLVAETTKSYKELPIKLYQISRKYRDEIRPRSGLLRGREFTMMDLYTFDQTYEQSLETYELVSEAYSDTFSEFGLNNVVKAEASSGDMGGNLSHEWHISLPSGSDTVFVCPDGHNSSALADEKCGYAANDEVATTSPRPPAPMEGWSETNTIEWRGITKDRTTLIRAWLYQSRQDMTAEDLNVHSVKKLVPDLDTSVTGLAWRTEDETVSKASRLVDIVDSRLSAQHEAKRLPSDIYASTIGSREIPRSVLDLSKRENAPDLVKMSNGDPCPRCTTPLGSERTTELGHTFYLGTRYTEPLKAKVTGPDNKEAPLHMSCYGIGVSRLMATIAEVRAEEYGPKWSWPPTIAPFHVLIIPVASEVTKDVLDFYDMIEGNLVAKPALSISKEVSLPTVVLDDRQRSFGWKMKDAEAMKIPITVVLGKDWKEKGRVELEIGHGRKQEMEIANVAEAVRSALAQPMYGEIGEGGSG